jgi:hypothetical protein
MNLLSDDIKLSLTEARRIDRIGEFIACHKGVKGNQTAFNATLEAMAGKSKAVPATSKKRNSDD